MMTSRVATYYEVLGVTRDASAAEIRAAYRACVRRWHPDLHDGSAESHARVVDINRAYETLCDPTKRRAYDELTFRVSTNGAGNGHAGSAPWPASGAAPPPPPRPPRTSTPQPGLRPNPRPEVRRPVPGWIALLIGTAVAICLVVLFVVALITALAQVATALLASLMPLIFIWWLVGRALRPARHSR